VNRLAIPSLAAAALASLALTAPTARAQFPDLLELSGQYMPGAELEDPEGAKAQLAAYDAAINVPIVINPKTFLIPGLAYHADAVSFANTPDDFVQLRAFHAVDLSLLFVRLLPRDWSLSVRVAPGLAGDFTDFDTGLIRVSAMAMATHAFSDRLVLGGGALASYSFGEWLPLPALYLDWTPNPWFRIETFIPAFARVLFHPHERVELGLRADIAGNSYAVRDTRVSAAPPCAGPGANQSACLDHVAYSVVTTGLEAGVRIASTLWFTAYGGHTVYRRFEQSNKRGKSVPGGRQTLPNQFFFRASLTWRIPQG
jgi:hypothetical protein